MRTRGTNPGTLTDAELRQAIVAAAIDVARWANNPAATSYEIHFASGTQHRLTHELRLRDVGANEAASDGLEIISA